jgi:hypothetical protein
MGEKHEIAERVTDILTEVLVFLSDDNRDQNAEQTAKDQVRSWIEDGKHSEMLVAALQNDPRVRSAIEKIRQTNTERPSTSATQMSSGVEEEVSHGVQQFADEYQADLDRHGGNKGDPAIVTKYSPSGPKHLSTFVDGKLRNIMRSDHAWLQGDEGEMEKVLSAVQTHINAKMQERPQASGPSPIGQPRHSNWFDIRREDTPEAVYHLATDKNYLASATSLMLRKTMEKLKGMESQYHKEDYKRALESLHTALTEKGSA